MQGINCICVLRSSGHLALTTRGKKDATHHHKHWTEFSDVECALMHADMQSWLPGRSWQVGLSMLATTTCVQWYLSWPARARGCLVPAPGFRSSWATDGSWMDWMEMELSPAHPPCLLLLVSCQDSGRPATTRRRNSCI